MKAWQMTELGEPAEVLRLVDVPDPTAGPGQALLSVDAVGLKFPDILQIQGRYQVKPNLPFIPGAEVAATVLAFGPNTDDQGAISIGDRVLWMGHGGLAPLVVAPVGELLPIPDSMSSEQAAAMLVNYGTGIFALEDRAKLQPGETLLVTAAAGGVGSAAIGLAKAMGATVYGLAGGPEKVATVQRLGADAAFDYRQIDIVDTMRDITDGRGVDVVYEAVGGDVFDQVRRVVAWDGRLLVIGFTSGRIPDVPANHILLKNYSVVGVHWGASLERDPRALGRNWAAVTRLFAGGGIDPLISEIRPLAEALDGLVAIGSRQTVGKLVVRPRQ